MTNDVLKEQEAKESPAAARNEILPVGLHELAIADWNTLDRELWPDSERDAFILGFAGGARWAMSLATQIVGAK